MTPRVSVLIPSYNHAPYLPAALQSVFDQTYRDYEIVVVDDGSTDGSVEILQGYGDRIRLFVQANSGHLPDAESLHRRVARRVLWRF
jgi:glycosyltransferase involved in cell wall biosynthesis